MSDDIDIDAKVQSVSPVTVEFTAGPLIMFWALQRLHGGQKVGDFSGDNRDNVPDAVTIDPAGLQAGETFPYSMAVMAPAADVQYQAVVQVVQAGKAVANHEFSGQLAANKAVNLKGTITLSRQK
jgi:hypothetical protein